MRCPLCGKGHVTGADELCAACCAETWRAIALRTLVGGDAARRITRVLRNTDGEDERRTNGGAS